MLVVSLVGSRAGAVVDLPPVSARAMVADGRARWLDAPAVEDAPAVVAAQVTARADRGLPATPRRARRG